MPNAQGEGAAGRVAEADGPMMRHFPPILSVVLVAAAVSMTVLFVRQMQQPDFEGPPIGALRAWGFFTHSSHLKLLIQASRGLGAKPCLP